MVGKRDGAILPDIRTAYIDALMMEFAHRFPRSYKPAYAQNLDVGFWREYINDLIKPYYCPFQRDAFLTEIADFAVLHEADDDFLDALIAAQDGLREHIREGVKLGVYPVLDSV